MYNLPSLRSNCYAVRFSINFLGKYAFDLKNILQKYSVQSYLGVINKNIFITNEKR